ncbi:MAG: 4-(cytidine 5'-diphospho)-2-C-methyl-D-erythritol kinase [Acidobacteriaceae bacterium]
MPSTLRSFCKINLGLAIGPPRPDGFHSLLTCYQTLEAHDLVTVAAAPAAATTLRLTSTDPRVPTDAANTAWKIVDLALRAHAIAAGVSIHIDKRLPVQGGLGAGSANAVAALLALESELAHHGIAPLPNAEKLRIAAQVGSDVPLFLIGGAILGLGRGEDVHPLPDFPPTECVLALPDVGVSTPQAFRDWDALRAANTLTPARPSDTLSMLSRALASAFGPGLPEGFSAGAATHSSGVSALGGNLGETTGSPANVFGGESNPLLALVRAGIANDFEEVVFLQHPRLGEIRRLLAESPRPEESALVAALSGSGSALFGLYGSAAAANAAEARLSAAGIRSLRSRTLPRGEYWKQMRERG